jgi:myo-inositol-1(or 4)-monophosphatase
LPEADLALLLDAARAASKIGLRHFGRAPETREKPGGHGPVTEADLEVDRMLRAELTAARPDYGWLSEETPDTPDRLGAERVFIIDPIDGTRAFIAGKKSWAHSLAVAERGRVIAGVVLLPAHDRVYAAAEGRGATLNGSPIGPTAREGLDGASVLANGGQFSDAHWPGGAPSVERHFRPSLAYRVCLAAEGRFDAMLTFRDTWEWDVAAGDLIAREAGAAVTTREGAPAIYNNPGAQIAGMVVAGPALHAEIMARRGGAG